MPTTLADLLKPALRMAGITKLAGNTPGPDQYGELIPAMNRMLGGWNIDGHRVFTSSIATYPLASSKKIYTIGPTGDFAAPRPAYIKLANFLFPTKPITRRPIHIADDDEWSRIAVQDISGAPPWVLYYDGGYDANKAGSIFIYPQPPAGYSLELYTWQALPNGFVAVTDIVTLPDGYEDAIVSNFALRVGALYPHEAKISDETRLQARQSLDALIALNSRSPKLFSEAAYLGGQARGGRDSTSIISGSGQGGGDLVWIDPILPPDGMRSTFAFANTPAWVAYNGLNQYVGIGYNLVGYRTIQLINASGVVIVPSAKDNLKAAINTGITTGSAGTAPSLTESYLTVIGTPSGTNGSDGLATFTLSASPTTLMLYRNGLLQIPGVSYTLSGNSVTFLAPNIPRTGNVLTAVGFL